MANTTRLELGSVVSLWRYPVKSMMGEELNAAGVTERGFPPTGIVPDTGASPSMFTCARRFSSSSL